MTLQIVRTLSGKLRRAAKRARIRRELEAHSDRQLADFGFSRYDIERIARQSVSDPSRRS